jgi:hypothetical protein
VNRHTDLRVVTVVFVYTSPIRTLLIFFAATENDLRRPWQAIQPLTMFALPRRKAALGMFIWRLGLKAAARTE